MPDPSTSRLGLYKSKSDGSELVNYTQDIGQNWDRVDAAVGFQSCTSTTRPSTPYSGKAIFETDTNRTYYSNGSSPASGSWVEIPNSAGTYGSNLTLASGSTLSIGAAQLTRSSGGSLSANTNFQRAAAATTDVAYSALLTGDTFDRVRVYADGKLEIGPGNAARDVNLYRSTTNTLATDDNLSVALGLTVGATTWTTYTPAVGNAGTATWSSRTGYYYKLGKIVFVVVYLAASAAGSGTSTLSVDMPSNVDRSTRQCLTLHAETVGVSGSTSATIRGGECVFFTGGTGGTSDRLRVDDSDGDGENNLTGVDIKSTSIITIQGWYREA